MFITVYTRADNNLRKLRTSVYQTWKCVGLAIKAKIVSNVQFISGNIPLFGELHYSDKIWILLLDQKLNQNILNKIIIKSKCKYSLNTTTKLVSFILKKWIRAAEREKTKLIRLFVKRQMLVGQSNQGVLYCIYKQPTMSKNINSSISLYRFKIKIYLHSHKIRNKL